MKLHLCGPYSSHTPPFDYAVGSDNCTKHHILANMGGIIYLNPTSIPYPSSRPACFLLFSVEVV
jgi:hypothetical protein